MDDENQPAPKAKKGYGKFSKTQWILIYIVAAIIVYGLIYLIFFRKSGSTGYSY